MNNMKTNKRYNTETEQYDVIVYHPYGSINLTASIRNLQALHGTNTDLKLKAEQQAVSLAELFGYLLSGDKDRESFNYGSTYLLPDIQQYTLNEQHYTGYIESIKPDLSDDDIPF